MRRLVTVTTALLLAGTLLTGCSETSEIRVPEIDLSEVELPDVDWERYEPAVRDEVERLVQEADCDGLREEVEAADPQLRRYLEAALDEAGC